MQAMAKRADASKCKPKRVKYNKANIIESVLNGDTLKEIALGYGVTLQAVQQWLLRNHPKDYQLVQDIVADNMADEMVSVAYNTEIEVPRARNIINSLQFRLERRHSSRYGQHTKQEVIHKGAAVPIINITLSAPEQPVAIDITPIDTKPLPRTNDALEEDDNLT